MTNWYFGDQGYLAPQQLRLKLHVAFLVFDLVLTFKGLIGIIQGLRINFEICGQD